MAAATPQLQLTGLSETRLITNVGLSVPRVGFSCQASTAQIRRYLDAAVKAAREALQADGYFNARIRPSIRSRQDCRDPALDIEVGPVTTIETVTVDLPAEIRSLGSVDRFISEHRPAPGEPLDQSAY